MKIPIYELPEEFTELGQWVDFNQSYYFDEDAIIQRTNIDIEEVEPRLQDTKEGLRKNIYVEVLIDNTTVSEAIEKARIVGNGSAEDIYGGLIRKYITLKKNKR